MQVVAEIGCIITLLRLYRLFLYFGDFYPDRLGDIKVRSDFKHLKLGNAVNTPLNTDFFPAPFLSLPIIPYLFHSRTTPTKDMSNRHFIQRISNWISFVINIAAHNASSLIHLDIAFMLSFS